MATILNMTGRKLWVHEAKALNTEYDYDDAVDLQSMYILSDLARFAYDAEALLANVLINVPTAFNDDLVILAPVGLSSEQANLLKKVARQLVPSDQDVIVLWREVDISADGTSFSSNMPFEEY